MFSITLLCVFDTEVINDQTEDKVAVLVEPQSRCVRKWLVSVWGKEILESIVGYATSLRKAIHAFTNLSIYGALVDQVVKFV